MSGQTNLVQLVKNMRPILNKGEYVFCSVKDSSKIDRVDTFCEIKEVEGITLVMEQKKADTYHLKYKYIAHWITLQVHSSLESVGLTAVFSNELAKHNISCNVIAGYYHDHIFIDKKDSIKALKVLLLLSENYQ